MSKSLSITIHPSALTAGYLAVSDAMHQVLDVIEALEQTGEPQEEPPHIVWRLTEAHTNSPPFTVTVEAFPSDPGASVGLAADRAVASFSRSVRALLDAAQTQWLSQNAVPALKRVFLRNMNGVGRTNISIEEMEPLNLTPYNARSAFLAIEQFELDMKAAATDHTRTEFGSLELEVQGILRWHKKPALKMVERLSREEVTCVLTQELADRLGAAHKWGEAWEGRRLLMTGALHYGSDNSLKRVDAEDAEDIPWTDVSLSDLRDIDVLQGRSVSEHIDLLRGEDIG